VRIHNERLRTCLRVLRAPLVPVGILLGVAAFAGTLPYWEDEEVEKVNK
jgi:hypothetical protein